MTGSTIIWYATSAPFILTFSKYDNLSGWLKTLYCFCPNTAMAYGFKVISRLEAIGVGLNWHTAFQTVSIYDSLTVASIFFIMITDAIILIMITLYVENVLPGGYGVAKPWYFVFTKEFWQGLKNYQQFEDHRTISEHSNLTNSQSAHSNFESEPIDRPIGIQIQNLTKKFTSDKAAVNQLYLNIYDNQITTLLGQNGAGKTTTISMLTGMMGATGSWKDIFLSGGNKNLTLTLFYFQLEPQLSMATIYVQIWIRHAVQWDFVHSITFSSMN